MIDRFQIEAWGQLLAPCLVTGIAWPIAWAASLPFKRHRNIAKLVVMSVLAAWWIILTARQPSCCHVETRHLPLAILPWWMAMAVGNLVKWKRRKDAEQ